MILKLDLAGSFGLVKFGWMLFCVFGWEEGGGEGGEQISLACTLSLSIWTDFLHLLHVVGSRQGVQPYTSLLSKTENGNFWQTRQIERLVLT